MISNPQKDFVLKTIESRDVHFVRFWFTDVLGRMKSFAIIPSELEDAFSDGMGFDACCIEGFATREESDMLAFPDPETFQVLPWRPEKNAVARMFCSVRTPDGRPFEGDPRHVLERITRKAADMGYIFNVGPELEYFYFRDSHGTEPLDRGGYFDLTSLDYASDLRRDTVLTLEKMGIPVEYSHHERGPSQHEIDLRYTDALSMADAVMTYKLVVKEIAMKHGVYASFMPKPMPDAPGSCMHVHQSLADLDGENAFFDANDPSGYNLSKTARHYIAGILRYAPEFSLVTNQYVNSYKRLTDEEEAPTRIAWARNNRSAIVRVPGYRPSREGACRIELRSPDPAANPYLAFAIMLAAGLRGIEDELELQDPSEAASMLQAGSGEHRVCGTGRLPEDLGEAVELFARSELMREVLGEHIHGYLTEAKRAEWKEYQRIVTRWEIDRGLGVL
ncbi:MAG: glutamine synthetase [Eggerthellaceae bacterium]|nr:glutamine synthetase [Eggerthellaceae bacterium]